MTPGGGAGARDDEESVGAIEHRLQVVRSARYWTLGEAETEPEEAWIVLHGYGQLARRFLRRFEGLASPTRLVVAPEALSRFYVGSGEGRHGPDALVGATWMTREDREAEIRDYVAYLDRLAGAALRGAPRVTVLGFSQGVATAWRWVALGRVPGLVRVVAWAGSFPHDLEVERAVRALGSAEVVVVSGEGDRTVRPEVAEAAAEGLRAAGVAVRLVRHAGGHDIDEETLLELAGRG